MNDMDYEMNEMDCGLKEIKMKHDQWSWLLVFIHQPFCHDHQIYKQLHYLLWGILTTHQSRVMH